ncbi:MAG TPA: alpha/beta family hydrolase [Candidatus Angelobacter sp.]|nr:alpha/beta family hydrolase [Candidatus Angelobacter sp.]
MELIREIADQTNQPPVRGFMHMPAQPNGAGLALTHGAGGNCQSKLLQSLAHAFSEAGYTVLRCNLPFRQQRAFGSPSPASAERDREGLRRAVEVLRQQVSGPLYLGGQSYGGRQASMLVADDPNLVSGLLLLSYPLHPPGRPAQLRTSHWPRLKTPALFVHGSRDPFGSASEFESALTLLPGQHELIEIEGAGHELLGKKDSEQFGTIIVAAFRQFFSTTQSAASK